MAQDIDPELSAMQNVLAALEPLDDDTRARVLGWAASRYEINLSTKSVRGIAGVDASDQSVADIQPPAGLAAYDSVGELFAAADPKTNAEKALVVGFWLQTRDGAGELTGQAINTELKHLGHGVANVTVALDHLKEAKPALAIQLRKAGTSQQARKTYKITEAGAKFVEAMVHEAAQ